MLYVHPPRKTVQYPARQSSNKVFVDASMKKDFRRKLICCTGYHGFKAMLKASEILVIEFEDVDSECTSFERIDNARQFKKINRIDGGDIFGIWAWQLSHWEKFDPKEDTVYDLLLDSGSAHNRVLEDIVLMAIHERRDAWTVYRTEEISQKEKDIIDALKGTQNFAV